MGFLAHIAPKDYYDNTTYRSLRVLEGDDQWAYGVWCTGEHELFDLAVCRPPFSLLMHSSQHGS